MKLLESTKLLENTKKGKYNTKFFLVYHIVNGDHALFHTSKTAKMIKV